MSIILRKLFHRDRYRIGVFFRHNISIQTSLKKIDGVYSKTHRCWHVEYSKEKYTVLKKLFPDLIVEQPVAGKVSSRDLPPTANGELQLGTDTHLNNPEHIANVHSLAQKLRVELLPNIGK
jgi:hypothetical protein